MSTPAMVTQAPAIAFLDLHALHAPLQGDLDRLWKETLASSGFIGGPNVAAFEQAWATYCGTQHAIGVANGTDAIELVLAALGVGPGDEVIVPANTFVATAEAVVTAGATPVFVDVDDATLLITAEHIEQALTERTRAVLVVHLYGQIPEMDPIVDLCERRDILLIEDAAQAHGATQGGRRAGSFGIAATFSFYPGKNLGALGDGGAVVTDDDELAELVRVLANHGRGHHLLHVESGRNSRLDGLQGGALLLKLAHLDAWNDARRVHHAAYLEHFADSAVQMLATPADTEPVHHLEVIRTDHRDELQAALAAQDIGTGIHYAMPCHLQPAFQAYAPSGSLPVAEGAARRQLSIPMHPTLTTEEVDRVAAAVLDFVARHT